MIDCFFPSLPFFFLAFVLSSIEKIITCTKKKEFRSSVVSRSRRERVNTLLARSNSHAERSNHVFFSRARERERPRSCTSNEKRRGGAIVDDKCSSSSVRRRRDLLRRRRRRARSADGLRPSFQGRVRGPGRTSDPALLRGNDQVAVSFDSFDIFTKE